MAATLNNILARLEAMENRFQSATGNRNTRTYSDVVKTSTKNNYMNNKNVQQLPIQREQIQPQRLQQQRQPLLLQPPQPWVPRPTQTRLPSPPQPRPFLPIRPLLRPPQRQHPHQARHPLSFLPLQSTQQQQPFRPLPPPPQQLLRLRPQHHQQKRHQQRAQPQHQQREQKHKQQQQQQQQIRYHTDNASFGDILKQLYRGTQLRNHSRNWDNLPEPVQKRINQLFRFLTPPMSQDEELEAGLENLKQTLMVELKVIIKTHLNKQQAINNHKMKNTHISEKDKQAAKEIAVKVTLRKYGRKGCGAHIAQWVEEDLEMMGRASSSSKILQHSETTTPGPSKKRQRDSPGATTESRTKKHTHQPHTSTASSMPAESPLTSTTSPTPAEPHTSTASLTPVEPHPSTTSPTPAEPHTSTASPTPLIEPHPSTTPSTPTEPSSTTSLTPDEPPHTPTTSPTPAQPHPSTTSPTPAEPHASTTSLTPAEPTPTEVQQRDAPVFKIPEPVSAEEGDEDLTDTSMSSQISVEPEPTTSSTITPTNTDRLRKFVYNSKNKGMWKLNVRHKPTTLVLGDSNMRLARNIPDDWEIHVYPGAYLRHAVSLLQTTGLPDSIKNIVVAVGVNHRSMEYASTKLEFGRVRAQAKILGGKQLHFLGVSTSSGLSTTEAANIRQLNADAGSSFGNRKFIRPLPTEQVTIAPSDPFRIHHDHPTVDRVIESIKVHLN